MRLDEFSDRLGEASTVQQQLFSADSLHRTECFNVCREQLTEVLQLRLAEHHVWLHLFGRLFGTLKGGWISRNPAEKSKGSYLLSESN